MNDDHNYYYIKNWISGLVLIKHKNSPGLMNKNNIDYNF